MEFFIRLLRGLLPAKEVTKPMEERLFEITLFLTVLTMLIWSVVGIVSGYTWFIEGVYLFAASFYSSLYIAVRKGKSFAAISAIYYLTALLLITVGWLPSGGLQGAVMHMCVLVYLSGLMVLPLRLYVIFMASTLGVVLCFITVEFYHPDWPAPYLVEGELHRDLSIAGLLMLTLMGIAFYIFKKEYLFDRKRLEETNKELEKEKARAEESDRAKTRFLTTISHGMRTPLNGIVGLTELLSKTSLSKEQQELVEHLGNSGDSLKNLISGVLDISAIENDLMALQPTDFELKDIFSGIPSIFKYALHEKKGRVTLRVTEQFGAAVYLRGDVKKLRQVIINLVSNALRFTHHGTVSLRCELLQKEGATATVLFSVEDTGTGIPAVLHQEIFRRYFSSDTAQQMEGPGMGLFIAKEITEKMGGKIWFTSAEGAGSSFYVELPLKVSAIQPASMETKPARPSDFTGLRVLVAEDMHINRMVILKILKNLGVRQVEVAEDGVEAVSKAMAQTYDFVLMDLQMPRMDGVEASREIHRLFAEKRIQPPVIVAVTANTMREDEEACNEAGMKAFITKPFTSQALAAVLENFRLSGVV